MEPWPYEMLEVIKTVLWKLLCFLCKAQNYRNWNQSNWLAFVNPEQGNPIYVIVENANWQARSFTPSLVLSYWSRFDFNFIVKENLVSLDSYQNMSQWTACIDFPRRPPQRGYTVRKLCFHWNLQDPLEACFAFSLVGESCPVQAKILHQSCQIPVCSRPSRGRN